MAIRRTSRPAIILLTLIATIFAPAGCPGDLLQADINANGSSAQNPPGNQISDANTNANATIAPEPAQPAPADPGQPTTPSDPVQPTDPSQPTEPTQPADPVEPVAPVPAVFPVEGELTFLPVLTNGFLTAISAARTAHSNLENAISRISDHLDDETIIPLTGTATFNDRGQLLTYDPNPSDRLIRIDPNRTSTFVVGTFEGPNRANRHLSFYCGVEGVSDLVIVGAPGEANAYKLVTIGQVHLPAGRADVQIEDSQINRDLSHPGFFSVRTFSDIAGRISAAGGEVTLDEYLETWSQFAGDVNNYLDIRKSASTATWNEFDYKFVDVEFSVATMNNRPGSSPVARGTLLRMGETIGECALVGSSRKLTLTNGMQLGM